jgi:bifunctional non-homologous end joining protein LigD
MAKKEVFVTLNEQQLKLSNLDKVLFTEAGIIKAEVIDYYLKMAPHILPFIQKRPLTLIRFPDGVDKTSFYSKNKPDYTPAWIASAALPDKPEITYIEANNEATLVYLANLAAIELHAMTLCSDTFMPDHFIFDLDPAENVSFEDLKQTASDLNLFLRNENFTPFLKTSGGKGLHIYVPILPEQDNTVVVDFCKKLCGQFISAHPNTTLTISKEKRNHKILLDIYRNHKAQTCAAPFTIRAKATAPVSMPVEWNALPGLKSSQDFTIHTANEYLSENGNAWQNFPDSASNLVKNKPIAVSNPLINVQEPLEAYSKKRDFENTTEPKPEVEVLPSKIPRYVIQKHRATNLHYDLRLEWEGVLLSWAIPKAIPHEPGIKRMAIQTEPHPLKYLFFEGIIPKEEYGGGEMWIFDSGEVEFIEKKEKKIHFKLLKGNIKGEFVIYNTDENKWLIERKDTSRIFNTISTEPMLASLASTHMTGYFYEIKWDGIRAIIKKEGEKVQIISRNQRDITDKFPEIIAAIQNIDAETALLDCEIVVLNEQGIPQFPKVISRMHTLGAEGIKHGMNLNPATAYVFDALFLDAQDIRNQAIEKRRAWIRTCFSDSKSLRFSQSFDDGQALFAAIKAQNMEGVILKKKGSTYKTGQRTTDWLKIKVQNIEDALIIGYTKGKGDRTSVFGALFLAQLENGILVYKGKVGTGFTEGLLAEIFKKISEMPKTKKPITDSVEEESAAVWIEPKLSCQLQFASLTSNNTFREPVFIKIIGEEDIN